MLLKIVQYVMNLGPTVILPLTITIIGIIFGQGFKKAFKSGITIGIGFVGINLVIGFNSLINPYILLFVFTKSHLQFFIFLFVNGALSKGAY